MQIQRDYSQPFFGGARRRRGRGRGALLLFGLLAMTGLFIYTQRAQVELMALDALGMLPAPTVSAPELADDAMRAALVGDLKTAAGYWAQVLAQRPDDVDSLHEYGGVLIDLEAYDEALALGERAIAANSFDPRGYALKARALIFAGRAAEALPVLLAGIEVDRRYAPLYGNMARAYAGLGNLGAALENAEKAVELAPNDAEIRRSYAYTLTALAEHDAAIGELTQAVALDPSNVGAQMELAFQYLARDEDALAIELYDQIIAQQPLNARAMLRLCSAYRKVGQFTQAIDSCERAVETDPTYVPAQFRLAMILYTDRDYARAQEGFSACASLQPDNLECKYRLGLTHFYLGDCAEGWRILQESLDEAQSRAAPDDVLANIRLGLGAITSNCSDFAGFAAQFPADVPPTEDPARALQPIEGVVNPVFALTPAPTAEGDESAASGEGE